VVSAASAVLGGLAGASTEVVVVRLAGRLGGETAARGLLAGAGALATLAELPASRTSAVALAGTAARVAGICALVGAVAPVQRRGDPLGDPRAVVAVGVVAAAAFAGWQQLERRSRPRRSRLEHFPPEHTLETTSARAGGLEGSRFVRTAVVPVAAEEHLSGGDVASVVVQYHDRRTLLMPLKVPIAARTHRALLEELRRRLPAPRPEVASAGESLGAWASQDVFRRGGVRALDEVGVDRALWIGTPYFSRLPRLLAAGAIPTDAQVRTVRTAELLAGTADRGARFLFVERLEGPLAVDLAYGHGAPREKLDALADQLVAEEVERGARIRALRRAGGYTPPH
jgi:hypothetical protein